MTIRHFQVEIDCGNTTCASEPGKFCRFFGQSHFGVRAHCLLFREPEGETVRLWELNGWIQRCEPCLEAEKTGVMK